MLPTAAAPRRRGGATRDASSDRQRPALSSILVDARTFGVRLNDESVQGPWGQRALRIEADRRPAVGDSLWDQMLKEERYAEGLRQFHRSRLINKWLPIQFTLAWADIGDLARLQACAPEFLFVVDSLGAWQQVPALSPLLSQIQAGRLQNMAGQSHIAEFVGVCVKTVDDLGVHWVSSQCFEKLRVVRLERASWSDTFHHLLSLATLHILDVGAMEGSPSGPGRPTAPPALQTLLAPTALARHLAGLVALRRLCLRVDDRYDRPSDFSVFAEAPNLQVLHVVEAGAPGEPRDQWHPEFGAPGLFGGLRRARLRLREFVWLRPRLEGSPGDALKDLHQSLSLKHLRVACLALNEDPFDWALGFPPLPGGEAPEPQRREAPEPQRRQAPEPQRRQADALAAAAPGLSLRVLDWPELSRPAPELSVAAPGQAPGAGPQGGAPSDRREPRHGPPADGPGPAPGPVLGARASEGPGGGRAPGPVLLAGGPGAAPEPAPGEGPGGRRPEPRDGPAGARAVREQAMYLEAGVRPLLGWAQGPAVMLSRDASGANVDAILAIAPGGGAAAPRAQQLAASSGGGAPRPCLGLHSAPADAPFG